MKPDTKEKRVRNLSRGDVLAGSGIKVLVAPSAGVRTPKRKVDLRVEYPATKRAQARRTWVTWGADTRVRVLA